VAGAAQWGKAMPAGFGKAWGAPGIARIHRLHGRARRRDPKHAKVVRATIAIDLGKPINPSGIEQQCHGGLAEAISLVLTPPHHQGRAAAGGHYGQYHWARMIDFPKAVEVIIMPERRRSGGRHGRAWNVGASARSPTPTRARPAFKPRKFPLNSQDPFVATPPGQLPTPPL